MVRQRQTTTKSDLRNALSKLLLQQPFDSITIRQLTETAAFMHYLFLIPLIGGALLVALQLVVKGLSRITLNLWNSAVATATAGALYRGIVNLSGRSTTLDQPYYYVAGIFLALALISIFFVRSVWVEKVA